jgi:hypothetical protein
VIEETDLENDYGTFLSTDFHRHNSVASDIFTNRRNTVPIDLFQRNSSILSSNSSQNYNSFGNKGHYDDNDTNEKFKNASLKDIIEQNKKEK